MGASSTFSDVTKVRATPSRRKGIAVNKQKIGATTMFANLGRNFWPPFFTLIGITAMGGMGRGDGEAKNRGNDIADKTPRGGKPNKDMAGIEKNSMAVFRTYGNSAVEP